MEINYRSVWELAAIRQKQIADISLETERFNKEHQLLEEMKNVLAKLQRLNHEKFIEVPAMGKVIKKNKEVENV